MYLLSLPEILGVFWMKVQGAEWAKAGFTTAYLNKIPQEPLYRDEYEEDYGPKISSKFPLFSFYKEAGLAYKTKHWGSSVQIYCEDWDKFQRWVTAYLQAYQDGKLLPNGNFLKAEKSETEMKIWLDQYRTECGNRFTLLKHFNINDQVFNAPIQARIWEELLLFQQVGIVNLYMDKELKYDIEQYDWLEVEVEVLQEMITIMTGAIAYLGIVITKDNKVHYRHRNIELPEKSDEFKLLKYLVEHQGEPMPPEQVYAYLKYKDKQKDYHNESMEVHGHKLSKKLSISEAKNQRLRSTKTRLLKKLGDDSLRITASQKEGVALKSLTNF